MAHLAAFQELLTKEDITEEVCFKLGETFDAAMTNEAWERLKGAYDSMLKDHGKDGEVIRDCKIIEDPKEAEEFTQMKGCIGAVVHPSGQVWPYKFVHALLQIVLKTGQLNLQAHTSVSGVSKRGEDGMITVKTSRGVVRAKAVVHATNAWASHLLPNFGNLIFPGLATLGAIKAPEGFIRHTGAQHWDSTVNNYHLQLPPPYNAIILGGAKQVLVHNPSGYLRGDEKDKHFDGVTEFFRTWPESDVLEWSEIPTELARPAVEGGSWTGIESSSIDNFPFVGAIPNREGHFIAAGFAGHGMPRILLSTAHLAPLVLDSLGTRYSVPDLVAPYPLLPESFKLTVERIEKLQAVDGAKLYQASVESNLKSAKKSYCNTPRCIPAATRM